LRKKLHKVPFKSISALDKRNKILYILTV
jgi:hypothetical protein